MEKEDAIKKLSSLQIYLPAAASEIQEIIGLLREAHFDGESGQSYGVSLVGKERQRQITEEGYSFEHDDQEDSHQLSDAATVYACHSSARLLLLHLWPWAKEYFKPDKDNTIDGRIRELTKAGALVCAEIDRLVRLKKGTRK